MQTGFSESSTVFEENSKKTTGIIYKDKQYFLTDMGKATLLKAMRGIPIFEFRNIRSFLPNVRSINHFIDSENYLGNIKVIVRGLPNDVDNLTPNSKLYICRKVLSELESVISSIIIEFEGTKLFSPKPIKDTFKNKVINISDVKEEVNGIGVAQSSIPINQELYLNIPLLDWYAFEDNYGTTEEKRLVLFLSSFIQELRKSIKQ